MLGSNDAGVKKATTIASVSTVGVTLDTATYVTAQQTDNSDPTRQVSIIINPQAIYRASLSGGATAGTALTQGTEDTGSSTGLLVSTDVDYSSPSFDEGLILCSLGANQGASRKITSLSGADAVPSVAFQYDTAIGDKFIALPFNFMGKQFVQLTTNLDHVNASVTIDTDNANFIPLKLILPADPNDIATKSEIDMVLYDSIYAAGAQ